MSLQYTTVKNFLPVSGPETIWQLKEQLKTQGWVVLSSGDGRSGGVFSSSTDILTHHPLTGEGNGGTQIANSITNNNAWFRIQSPDTKWEFLIAHRDTGNNQYWRIKLSVPGASGSAGFTINGYNGSGTQNQIPGTTVPTAGVSYSANDEVQVLGSGTATDNPAGSNAAELFQPDGSYRCSIVCDNAAPYGFWMASWKSGGGPIDSCFFFDPVLNAGSASDPFPFVVGVQWNADTTGSFAAGLRGASSQNVINNYLTGQTWIKATISATETQGSGTSASFVSVAGCPPCPSAGASSPCGRTGSNPFTAKDDVMLMTWLRDSTTGAPTGIKGISSLLNFLSGNRSTGDTVSLVTASDRIVFDSATAPWDGTIPVV